MLKIFFVQQGKSVPYEEADYTEFAHNELRVPYRWVIDTEIIYMTPCESKELYYADGLCVPAADVFFHQVACEYHHTDWPRDPHSAAVRADNL